MAVDWGLFEMFPFMARIRSSQFGHRWEGLREQRASQSYSRKQPKSEQGGGVGRGSAAAVTGQATPCTHHRLPSPMEHTPGRASMPPQGSLGTVSLVAWFVLFM